MLPDKTPIPVPILKTNNNTDLNTKVNPNTSDKILDTIRLFAIAVIGFLFKKSSKKNNKGKHSM